MKKIFSVLLVFLAVCLCSAAVAAELQVHDTFTLGTYPQTREGDDRTPIQWLVLDVQENKALVITLYGIDAGTYHDTFVKTSWEKCDLRKWLNGRFMERAFTEQEQALILTTLVDNSQSQCYDGWKTSGGNDTEDKLFLLSYAEAWTYFTTDEERCCQPTDYATANHGSHGSNGYGWWWLRSPGYQRSSAADVTRSGSINGSCVDHFDGLIRPAMWIDLAADTENLIKAE